MVHRLISTLLIVTGTAAILGFVCMAMTGDKTQRTGLPPGYQQWLTAQDIESVLAVQAAMRVDDRMTDLSLQTSEQVEFLLTPALLVQEALSDDVVLTYPEE